MENSAPFLKVYPSSDTLELIRNSKEAAREHPIIFHCTKTEAFLNIIKTREFWLRNLKLVNDKEEAEKIILPEFKCNFFVASFTFKDDVSREHWEEYSSLTDGILFSVSQDWFYRNATPMMIDNVKLNIPVYRNFHEGYDEFCRRARIVRSNENIVFCLEDFAFYKIVYSDEKETVIIQEADAVFPNDDDEGIPMELIIPNISGVIKKRSGLCSRDEHNQYLKNWEDENEVRLKIRIQQVMTEFRVIPQSNMQFDKAAVGLTELAFDKINIRFSPEYPEEKKGQTIREISRLSPATNIFVIE